MKAETLPINARLLEPAEIAARFVSNGKLFDQVSAQNHAILLGPRGSGKTTMLAMLTRPAQRVWVDRDPANSSNVDFMGVLVRADLTWSRQLRHIGHKLGDTDRRTLMLAVYMNRAFMAMARYSKDLLLEKLDTTPAAPRAGVEAQIVRHLAAPCRLPHHVESLTDVKLELNARNAVLWDAANTGQLGALTPAQGVRLDLFSAAASLSEALRELGLVPRIALLLDELELVPREVRNYLREGLRDADSDVLLKMSLSPAENSVRELVSETAGSENDDFVFVDLSYPLKTHGYDFTSRLLTDLARRRGMHATSSPQILGRSRFEPGGPPRGQSAYGEDSDLIQVFRTLARVDESFAHYLHRHEIDLSDVRALTELERAAAVRKIRDIVIVREASRRVGRDGRLQKIAARRTGSTPLRLYAGNASVLSLLEGNPRWIVNFMTFATENYPKRSIRTREQTAALNDVLTGVLSRIAATPVPVDADREVDPERGQKILRLIERIGRYFAHSVHDGPFNPDPVLTFRCDASLSDEMRDLVADGAAHGAFIFIPDQASSRWQPTINGRFRLAYLVAARYELPLILGREVNLSKIVGGPASARDSAQGTTGAPTPDELILFR